MNQLIPVHTAAVTTQRRMRTVDGRKLHAMLNIQDRYEDWLTARIESFHYDLWLDYVPTIIGGSSVLTDYLSIDMACELASFERTGEWEVLCDFFSEIERETEEEYFEPLVRINVSALATAA